MTQFLKKHPIESLLTIFALIFSFWLMFATFSYQDGSMLIASKAWSDFASHIPLIRSFSLGANFPPEYPLFPGEPIRYHFLFYLLVGLLERMGLRIDFALNVPSALSFSALILIIYSLAKLLFKSRAVGVLAVIFFLFNGSLSFLEFFKNHPLSLITINEIVTNTTFPSFGPYDGKIVSAFWNLNIYTNQRHLALPFALLLLLVYFLFRNEKKLSVALVAGGGVFLGILPFSHSSIFVMAFLVLSMLFVLLPKQRGNIALILAVGVLLSLPRILFLKSTASFLPLIKPGYLVYDNLTFQSFAKYWFFNLGLSLATIPLGFALSPKSAKKLFVAFLPLLLVGNFVQFSIEMAGNHKFFNVFLAIANIFTAYLIVKLWKINRAARILAAVTMFLLTISGIIDFFPIKNDQALAIEDYPKNKDVAWIVNNTPKDAVFLNSSYLYNPASLAGHKIFLGWPYFPWSLGYDTNSRTALLKQIYEVATKGGACSLLAPAKIDYIETQPLLLHEDFTINYSLFEKNFVILYKNPATSLTLYDVNTGCQNVD